MQFAAFDLGIQQGWVKPSKVLVQRCVDVYLRIGGGTRCHLETVWDGGDSCGRHFGNGMRVIKALGGCDAAREERDLLHQNQLESWQASRPLRVIFGSDAGYGRKDRARN